MYDLHIAVEKKNRENTDGIDHGRSTSGSGSISCADRQSATLFVDSLYDIGGFVDDRIYICLL